MIKSVKIRLKEDVLLLFGDCLLEMDKLINKGIKVDAIITDIPYGVTACKWDTVIPFAPMWERIKGIRKDRAAVALFGTEPFSSMLRMSNLKEFKYDWIWNKSRPSGMSFKYQPMRIHEIISVFSKGNIFNPIMEKREGFTEGSKERIKAGKLSHTGKGNPLYNIKSQNKTSKLGKLRKPTSILRFGSVPNNGKEKVNINTQKPLELMKYFVLTYTNPGDTVLDFTMGSGTTLCACKELGRKGIGIENNKKTFDIAVKRIKGIQFEDRIINDLDLEVLF